MSQEQLFSSFGPVRVIRRGVKTTAQRDAERVIFISEMQGKGWLRFHPRTGRWYEIDGGRCRTAHPHPCQGCGRTVYRSRKHVRKFGAPTCPDCKSNGSPVGATRPNGHGYVDVKTHDGWQLEHRVVMERLLGRTLLDTETVHHINGVRSDNLPTNLQLRHGHHGAGVVMRCCDCGSHNVVAVEIGGADS